MGEVQQQQINKYGTNQVTWDWLDNVGRIKNCWTDQVMWGYFACEPSPCRMSLSDGKWMWRPSCSLFFLVQSINLAVCSVAKSSIVTEWDSSLRALA